MKMRVLDYYGEEGEREMVHVCCCSQSNSIWMNNYLFLYLYPVYKWLHACLIISFFHSVVVTSIIRYDHYRHGERWRRWRCRWWQRHCQCRCLDVQNTFSFFLIHSHAISIMKRSRIHTFSQSHTHFGFICSALNAAQKSNLHVFKWRIWWK